MPNNSNYQEFKVPLRVIEKVLGITVDEAMQLYYALSETERNIADLVASGLEPQEINDKLNHGYNCVNNYVVRIANKIKSHNRCRIASIVFMVKLAHSDPNIDSP